MKTNKVLVSTFTYKRELRILILQYSLCRGYIGLNVEGFVSHTTRNCANFFWGVLMHGRRESIEVKITRDHHSNPDLLSCYNVSPVPVTSLRSKNPHNDSSPLISFCWRSTLNSTDWQYCLVMASISWNPPKLPLRNQ